MKRTAILATLSAATLAACAGDATGPAALSQPTDIRPLETLPAHTDLARVRQDVIATAADRFGAARLAEARSEPTHLVAKRFAGMVPPPPPGAGSDWRPLSPAVLMVRRPNGWVVATATGWRPANAEAAADLDAIVADQDFWSEAPYTPPCPDFGASLLLLNVAGRAETVRNSTCSSNASRAVEAALRA